MIDQSRHSAHLYERALKVLPGGVSRNTVLRDPHPAYATHGSGCRIWDMDGVERLDFSNNMASLIHGHAHPAITAAVCEQVQKGTAFTMATEAEVAYAEYLCARGRFDRVRFVNSGTEAVMGCLKAARAFTGRPKIAKVEGAYHGIYDYAEISQTAQPTTWGDPDAPASVPVAFGTPPAVLDDVVVIPFNDTARALAILDRHVRDLSSVLLDPLPHRIGLIPAAPEFVRALRDFCDAHGALLVFDEVITFRSSYGGAKDWFDVTPDLTAMGKIIGGGFPVGALAGRADVMEVLNPLATPVRFPHSGTFSANPVTMAAGHTAMRLFDEAEVARLNGLGALARTRIAEAIAATGVAASVTGAGSMFRVHMTAEPPHDYRSAFAGPAAAARLPQVLDALFDAGILMINTCSGAISTPMTEREIDRLAESMAAAFGVLARSTEPHAIPGAGTRKVMS